MADTTTGEWLNCFFWNIKGVSKGSRPLVLSDERYQFLTELLTTVTTQKTIDVLVLAESPFEGMLSLDGLICAETLLLPNRKTNCRLEVYFRAAKVNLIPIAGVGRTTIQKINVLDSRNEDIMVAAHLESPDRKDREEQRKEAVRALAAAIVNVEENEQHQRTLLVGDLNYSPYDMPMYAATGLHAVPTRKLAESLTRTVAGQTYPVFYNPMWAHLGSSDGETAGTYYKYSNTVDCRFWHLFDQLMLRPALLPFWKDENLVVLKKIGEHPLADNRGVPRSDDISDHLPLLFRLNL